eukprot:1100603-Alexandrium_andersonii.AAC.1
MFMRCSWGAPGMFLVGAARMFEPTSEGRRPRLQLGEDQPQRGTAHGDGREELAAARALGRPEL